ncbi:MFS general substrate transporter [Rhizopogon vinicolor AM-OR11-026]|uniref:MFS general substrate transporter n=1 Tax=Rhizopogon vinicolor AM-OR11-026 TaxID=1314800 RepID=A0A1B7MEZ1_9AGAM|nr:MFS general substrate transporter [Rhizopogon vinicolor AM-OR11-026]
MASESKTLADVMESQVPSLGDKEGSEILEEFPVLKHSDVPSPSHSEFPEGGLAAWATVFGSFLVQVCTLGYSLSFGVYQDFYTQHYLINETPSAISWIGSLSAFLMLSVGVISGSLYDGGYFYHLIIAGSLLQSFSLFMLSLAKPNQYYQIFLAQSVCSGLASGLLYIPSLAVISHHFRWKRTLAMSLVASGSSLGSIIFPIMLNNLLNSPAGFANGVRASAGLVSGLLVIACLCMRTRLDPPAIPVNYISVIKKCIHDVPFVFMMAGNFLFVIGAYYPAFFLQLDSIKHGVSSTFSFYSLVILNASNFIGRVTSGYIAAFTGVQNLTILAAFSCAVVIFGMIGLSSLVSVVVLGVFYGSFAGVWAAMTAPLLTTLVSDVSELGARMGITFFINGLGFLIGPPISGALLTSNYTWWAPALFSGIVALAGAMMYTLMRLTFVRSQIKGNATRSRL